MKIWTVKVTKKGSGQGAVEEVLALYEKLYEERYLRKLNPTLRDIAVREAAVLIQRVGLEVSKKAITASVRHPRLKWVHGSHVQFCANRRNFDQFVEQHLNDPILQPGESSQWTGGRSDSEGEKPW